jgi:hypothetical protein
MDVCAIGARTTSQNILSDSADDFVEVLRNRIEDELQIPGDCVTAGATHTHEVPRMLCDDKEQVSRIVGAIRKALENMIPVHIGIGSGYEDKLTFNRTMMLKDGTDYSWRPHARLEDIEKLRPIDPEIGVIRIDRLDGSPFAVVYNFATHVLSGSPKGNSGHVTAGHVGVTEKYIEESLGNAVMAFFLQGANGDISEVTVADDDLKCKEFGIKLGKSVLSAYKHIAPGKVNVDIITKNIKFPLRTDIPDVIETLELEQEKLRRSLNTQYAFLMNFEEFLPLYLKYKLNPDTPSYPAYKYLQAEISGDKSIEQEDKRYRNEINKYLERIRTMEKMTVNEGKISMLQKHQEVIDEIGTATIPAEIKGIRIGECVLITAPMEILSEIGFNVKKASPFKQTYIVSLSNGYLHYSPPASYYPRGGYEVTECLLAPEWEKIFEDTVKEIFAEIKK